MALLRFITILSLLVFVTSFKYYQNKLPNGNRVPHPCKANYLWAGVGHYLVNGGGARNPFGEDFTAAGNTWSKELCQKDSDGDGRTNGEELGDPTCVWTEGDIPTIKEGITHPGICDPWDSPNCFKKSLGHVLYTTQEIWMREMCKAEEFVCPQAFNDTGLRTLNISLPAQSQVPSQETTYICQFFQIPDGDYHLVATQPLIDNDAVLHHIALFGCTDDEEITGEPFQCGMQASRKCSDFVSLWTVGLAGECFHSEAGVRIGTNGYRQVAVQLHWNNPEKRSDLKDGSGMQLHFTPNKRANDAGLIITGSDLFYLFPGQEEIHVGATCSAECTNTFIKDTIYVTSAWDHMHYAGIRMNMQLRRGNGSTLYLTNDLSYSYDSPQIYFKDTPVEIHPGDEISTNCYYTTKTKTNTLFYGDATSEEMCYGFLTFYPKMNAPNQLCLSKKGFVQCGRKLVGAHGCPNIYNFYNENYVKALQIYQKVFSSCRNFAPCLPECVTVLVDFFKTNPCARNGSWEMLQEQILIHHDAGWEFLSRIQSCSRQVHKILNPAPSVLIRDTTESGLTGDRNQNSSLKDTGNRSSSFSLHFAVLFVNAVVLVKVMIY